MPDYLIFQAQVPPHFNYEAYREQSKEPIRYDVVTVVEADTPNEAIQTLVNALGRVASGMAAVECFHMGYEAKGKLGAGGKLIAPSKRRELESDNGDDEDDDED